MGSILSSTPRADVEASVTLAFASATGGPKVSGSGGARVALTTVTFMLRPDGRVSGRGRGRAVLKDGRVGLAERHADTVRYDAMSDDIRLAVAEGLREAVRRAGDDVLALSRAVAEMASIPAGGA